jgi:cyclopropane-fatty-acyl-phospholipid synthase
VIARYFAMTYRVLGTPAGREFLMAARERDAPAVHGYSTADDIAALTRALRPSPDDLVVDLGCGISEVAIAVHRRSGCRVVGIDASERAVNEARRRADEAGVADAVRFEVGDIGTKAVGGSVAYALDSLMFVRRAPDVLSSALQSLGPPGRLFATFIDHRGRGRDSFTQFLTRPGVRLELLEDVSASFLDQSRRRTAAARRVLRARPPLAGRMGLLLIVAEEAIVARMIERGRLRRWRFTLVRSPPGRRRLSARSAR